VLPGGDAVTKAKHVRRGDWIRTRGEKAPVTWTDEPGDGLISLFWARGSKSGVTRREPDARVKRVYKTPRKSWW